MSAARGLYVLILTGLWSFALVAENVYGQTLLPIADSFVASDSPTTNYGTAAYLLVQGNNATVSDNKQFVYLKFDISSLSANVSTAKVRLYPPNTLLEPRVLAAYSVADNSWTETGITWNNRPSHSVCAIGEIYPSVDQQATWQEIDITEYVRNEVIAGHSTLSLAFHMSDDEGAAPTTLDLFNSREASSNGPQLVVTTGPYASPVSAGSPFVATADAGVRSGSPTTNFNQKLNQVFQSGATPEYVWNYIKFDTSTFIPTVDSAKLRMFGARRSNVASPPSDAMLLVYSVADTTWVETGITWTNKPAIGASPSSTITISDNAMQWREWDVSSYVQAEKAAGRHVVSFAIKNNVTASNISKFHAREASCKLPALYLKAPVALYFIHPDHLNTPRLVADATGTTVWRWDQGEPFGNNPADENPSGLGAFDLPLRLPGQVNDKETNLHYNYFRDYDPSLGIYKQSDLLGLRAGLNTYAYGGSVPLSRIDPFGLEWQLTIGVSGSIGGNPYFPFLSPFIGGGLSIGFTTSGQIILQTQATGSLGVGIYGGVGVQGQASRSNCPTPSGMSVQQALQGDFNFGAGPSVGGSIQYDPSSGGGGIQGGLGRIAQGRLGVGYGLQTSAGVTQTTTFATPALFSSKPSQQCGCQ